MAGRQVDNQPTDPALTHRGKLGGDDLDVPVHQECRLRVELVETALGKKPEVRAQDRLIFGGRKLAHCGSFFVAPKACSHALDDLLVSLGESPIGGGGIGIALDIAEEPQHDLDGYEVGLG